MLIYYTFSFYMNWASCDEKMFSTCTDVLTTSSMLRKSLFPKICFDMAKDDIYVRQ